MPRWPQPVAQLQDILDGDTVLLHYQERHLEQVLATHLWPRVAAVSFQGLFMYSSYLLTPPLFICRIAGRHS